MKNITEEDIERYVRFPESLSPEKYAQIEQAVANSSELRQLRQWFESYYDQVELLSGRVSRYIPLTNCAPPKPASMGIVLAAMSPETTADHELNTLATFASEREQLIVRFLQDTATGRCRLHLIRSKEPADHELSMICMPEYEINLFVDATRHLEFEPFENFESISWQDVHLAMRLPAGYVSLDPNDLTGTSVVQQTGQEEAQIFYEKKEGILKVQFSPGEEAGIQPFLVCQQDSQKIQYRGQKSSKIKIPVKETASSIQLWFFV